MRISLSGLLPLLTFFLSPKVLQAETLPYTDRTQPYGGASATVRGDIRTVGMSGANAILGDTFLSAFTNPAGLAMTLSGVDTTFTSDTIFDSELQNFDSPIHVGSIGVATSCYPWGFSVGYRSPYREEQPFYLSAVGDSANLDVTTRELQFAAARVLFDNRLSIGLSLTIGQAERAMEFTNASNLNAAYHSYTVGAGLGLLYQLANHELLGLSYQLPMRYPGTDSMRTAATGVNGFFQDVSVPATLTGGYGWIPNRFFRAATALEMIDATSEASILANNSIRVGQRPTLQLHVGAAYVLAQFKEFEATGFLGSYWEKARVEDTYSRLHATFGIETKLWVVNVGGGIDYASGYRNYLFSVGVDLFKIMEKIDLVPRNWHPANGGLFPAPFALSDDGLARPLVADWRPHEQDLNPIQMGLEIPKRLQQTVESAGEAIKKVLGAEPKVKAELPPEPQMKEPPKLKPKKKKRRKRTAKKPVSASPAQPVNGDDPGSPRPGKGEASQPSG